MTDITNIFPQPSRTAFMFLFKPFLDLRKVI